MKRLSVLTAAAMLFAACGSGSTETSRNQGVRSSSPEPTVTVSPMTETAEALPNNGIKVVKPQTAKFDGGRIPDGWSWVDPNAPQGPTIYSSNDGKFSMLIATGRDLFGENRSAPRLVKAISGDFQIETRIKFEPKQDYQGAGLVIYVDGNNYLRFERAHGGVSEGGSGIRLDVSKNGSFEALTTPGEIPTTAPSVDLKVIRRGQVFTAFWRLDENAEWREAEEFESDFPGTVAAGIIGCNTGDPITAEFGYIKLLPQPVEKPF